MKNARLHRATTFWFLVPDFAVESDGGESKMTEAEAPRTHVDLFNGALKSRDWDELTAIYSDDYMPVRPDCSVLSKEEVLKTSESGDLSSKRLTSRT